MRLCPKCDAGMKLQIPKPPEDQEQSRWECEECGYYERFNLPAARRKQEVRRESVQIFQTR